MPRSHWVKIDRALEHIDALDAAIEAWMGDDSYSIREETGPYVDPEGFRIINVKRHAVVLRLKNPIPAEWSAMIGDAAHNLRSALDHIAFALNAKGYANRHDGANLPAESEQASEFPIVGYASRKGESAAAFFDRLAQRKLAFAHPKAVRHIKGIQPYEAPDFTRDPLWAIYNLDRVDKHRQLVVAVMSVESMDIGRFGGEGPFMELGLGRVGPLQDGDEFAHWVPVGDEPEMDYDFDIALRVAFGHGSPCAGWPVVETLRDLRDYVRRRIAGPLDAYL